MFLELLVITKNTGLTIPLNLLISLITFVASVGGTYKLAMYKLGRLETKVKELESRIDSKNKEFEEKIEGKDKERQEDIKKLEDNMHKIELILTKAVTQIDQIYKTVVSK